MLDQKIKRTGGSNKFPPVEGIKGGFFYKPVLLIILCWITGSAGIYAQEERNELRLLARPMSDSILLRWAPASYQLWLSGNRHGYMVSRTCLLKDGKFLDHPQPVILTGKPLKPAPLNQWEKPSETDGYAGVAAQAIWGDDFEVSAGGSQNSIVDIMNRATEQQSKFGFALLAADMSPVTARLSGLWLTDKDVRPGEKYLYKVWPAYVPEGMAVDTAFYYTGVDEYRPLPPPANVIAKPGDKAVMITWEKFLQDGVYTGFRVERSVDGEQSFKRLNQSLLVNTTPEGRDEVNFYYYVDSLPDNRHDFYYRIVGVSPFGEEGPPSQIVSVKGENKIKFSPRIVAAESSEEGVKIDWSLESTDHVDGFRLYRSQKFKDGYALLADSLPVMQHSYLDESPLPAGYYRLQAFNSGGSGPLGTPKMVQVIDSVPPAVPTGLKASIDSTGIVSLQWNQNSDPDIFGYRIFRANARNEEFSQLTKKTVQTNRYADTINIKTLTKKVYYKILAVDQRQNWSEFSDILEADRPDVVPPASPLITSVSNESNAVALKWNQSPSSDVMMQLIYRNKAGSLGWTLIEKLPARKNSYRDSLIRADIIYHYMVLAVDSAGNESKPGRVVAGKLDVSKKILWIEPETAYRKKDKTLQLIWTKNDIDFAEYKQLVIYRKKNTLDSQWELFKVADPSHPTVIEAYMFPKAYKYKGKLLTY